MKIITPFLVFFLWIINIGTTLAAELENEEVLEISNFYFLELAGAVISIISLIGLIRVASIIGGGLGKMVKLNALAILLFTLSLIWRAYAEYTEIEGFLADVIFEVPIYMGLILFLIGSIIGRNTFVKK